MNDLLAGLLSALVATNASQVVSNLVQQKTGLSITVPDPNDPAERAYQKVMVEDDEALAEITRWREDQSKLGAKPNEITAGLLSNRIRRRAEPVRKSYQTFLQQNPKHTNGRIAFAAFLAEVGDEAESGRQLELAVESDTNSPAALNNLANFYGHNGQAAKCFDLYDRAMQLDPKEPLYCENLATTVFMFRPLAMAHYKISEPEVFDKAILLYRKALELDPTNFDRAVELAKTYYGIKPPPSGDPQIRRQAELKLAEEALSAWEMAFKIATSDEEREGVRLHFARWHINAGRLDEARKQLDSVTNSTFTAGRKGLLKRMEKIEGDESGKPRSNPVSDGKETVPVPGKTEEKF